MRILPHHDDTGGFFIAVFEKVAKYPEAGGIKRPRTEDEDASAPSAADVAATEAAVDAASQADQASMAAVAAAKAASDRADVMLQNVGHAQLCLICLICLTAHGSLQCNVAVHCCGRLCTAAAA